MNTTEKTISINGLNISYHESGASSTPVIFLHGFPFNKSAWEPQMEVIGSQYRMINYDLRGFGNSDADAQAFSMDLFADDLIHFMDAMHIPTAIVCGLSMGGYIILNAVDRYPERFKAIILCDTQCVADTPEGVEKRFKTIEQINANGLNEFTEGFLKNVFYAETFTRKPETVEQIRNIILSTPVTTVTNTLKALAERRETCSILNKIQIPTLIICGKEDKITPPEKAQFLHENIADSELHIIENAGHLSNMEETEIFNDRLKNFLDALS